MSTNETGGLVLIHFHNNKELLDLLSAVNGKLYYDGKPVFPINDPDLLNLLTDTNDELYYNGKPVMLPIKVDDNNALVVTPNRELFVNGKYFLSQKQYDVLSKFDYAAYLLTFDGKEVGVKVSDTSVEIAVKEAWQNIDNDANYSWLKKNSQEEDNNDAG